MSANGHTVRSEWTASAALPLRDYQDPPAWVESRLKGAQRHTTSVTRWMLLLDSLPDPIAKHAGLRLLESARTNPEYSTWPSFRTLAKRLSRTANTAQEAIRTLEHFGMIHVERLELPSGERQANRYYLAWPGEPWTRRLSRPACGVPTANGRPCARPPGWGVPGATTGPCKLHRGVDAVSSGEGGAVSVVDTPVAVDDAGVSHPLPPSSLGHVAQ